MRAGPCDSIGRMSVLCGDFESAGHPVLPCRALERRRGWLLAATVIAPQQVGISKIASITDRITVGRRGSAHARRLPLTTAARRRSQHEGKSWSDLPRSTPEVLAPGAANPLSAVVEGSDGLLLLHHRHLGRARRCQEHHHAHDQPPGASALAGAPGPRARVASRRAALGPCRGAQELHSKCGRYGRPVSGSG